MLASAAEIAAEPLFGLKPDAVTLKVYEPKDSPVNAAVPPLPVVLLYPPPETVAPETAAPVLAFLTLTVMSPEVGSGVR